MRTIPFEGGPIRIAGALDLDRSGTGIMPRRLPAWTRPQVPPFMEIMVTQPSGVRLEFTTDSSTIELDVLLTLLEVAGIAGRPPADGVFDLVVDGTDIRAARGAGGDRLLVSVGPPGPPGTGGGETVNDPLRRPARGYAPLRIVVASERGRGTARGCASMTARGQKRALRSPGGAGCTTAVPSVTAPARTAPRARGLPSLPGLPGWS